MWRLTVVTLAAGLAMAVDAAAAGFWLPPNFGGNDPDVIVAIGDSITAGELGDGPADDPYPALLQELLQPAHPGVVVRNRGVGGETTGGGLNRLDNVLAADKPGFVLIMEGTNDANQGHSPDSIVANLRAMVRLAKANLTIPILGAIINTYQASADDARAIIAEVNARLPGVAAAEGIRFVDTFTPMNHRELYGADELHPTQEGYHVLAAAWLPAVSAAITESRVLVGGVTVAGFTSGMSQQILTGFGPSVSPTARRFAGNAQVGPDIPAYGSGFLGGVHVAACDFDGDNIDDVLVGPGPGGGPHVRLLRLNAAGNVVGELASFFAYNAAFTGGVFVACGDVDGPPVGTPEIVLGAGPGGGPHVRVLRYAPLAPGGVTALFDFFAYDPGFTGGVDVAAGDVDNDGSADIITGAGPGGGPHVRAIKLLMSGGIVAGIADLASFFPYNPGFTGGVHVAAGDVNGGGGAEIVTGAGPGGGPHVRVFDATGLATGVSFFAYDPGFLGGVFVGVAGSDVLTGAGPGGGPHVRVFDATGLATGVSFFAY